MLGGQLVPAEVSRHDGRLKIEHPQFLPDVNVSDAAPRLETIDTHATIRGIAHKASTVVPVLISDTVPRDTRNRASRFFPGRSVELDLMLVPVVYDTAGHCDQHQSPCNRAQTVKRTVVPPRLQVMTVGRASQPPRSALLIVTGRRAMLKESTTTKGSASSATAACKTPSMLSGSHSG